MVLLSVNFTSYRYAFNKTKVSITMDKTSADYHGVALIDGVLAAKFLLF